MRELRGEVRQDHYGKLQAFSAMHRHQLNAAALLLQHGRFAGIAAFVFALQIFDEGAKTGCGATYLKATCQVGQAVDIRKNALAALAESEAGMRASVLQQLMNGIRDRPRIPL